MWKDLQFTEAVTSKCTWRHTIRLISKYIWVFRESNRFGPGLDDTSAEHYLATNQT